MNLSKMVIANNVKTYFEKNKQIRLYDELNKIIAKITHFNEEEIIMIFLSKNQDSPYSIKLFCNGLESNKKSTITIRFGTILNNQSYMFTNPLLEVDEEYLDQIYQYTIEIDNDELKIYSVLSKEKNNESGYHYYK